MGGSFLPELVEVLLRLPNTVEAMVKIALAVLWSWVEKDEMEIWKERGKWK